MRHKGTSRGAFVSLWLLLAVILSVPLAAPAFAQYPPAPLNPECHQLTVVGAPTVNQGGRILVPYLGSIRVAGEPGCTQPGEEIEVWAQSHLINIQPGFNADADGSFVSPAIALPAHLTPGPHQIRPTFMQSNTTFFCPILILDAAGNPAGGGGGGLGAPNTTSTNSGGGGGGGGGTLPKTGSDILALLLLALALLGAGTLLRLISRLGGGRKRRRSTVLRRRRTTPHTGSFVPRLDTADFVSMRVADDAHPSTADAPLSIAATEADVFR